MDDIDEFEEKLKALVKRKFERLVGLIKASAILVSAYIVGVFSWSYVVFSSVNEYSKTIGIWALIIIHMIWMLVFIRAFQRYSTNSRDKENSKYKDAAVISGFWMISAIL